MAEIERHYSVVEAAKLLGNLNPNTLYNWAAQGRLRRVKIGSRFVIAASELRRLLSEGIGPKPLCTQKTVAAIAEECDRAAVA